MQWDVDPVGSPVAEDRPLRGHSPKAGGHAWQRGVWGWQFEPPMFWHPAINGVSNGIAYLDLIWFNGVWWDLIIFHQQTLWFYRDFMGFKATFGSSDSTQFSIYRIATVMTWTTIAMISPDPTPRLRQFCLHTQPLPGSDLVAPGARRNPLQLEDPWRSHGACNKGTQASSAIFNHACIFNLETRKIQPQS